MYHVVMGVVIGMEMWISFIMYKACCKGGPDWPARSAAEADCFNQLRNVCRCGSASIAPDRAPSRCSDRCAFLFLSSMSVRLCSVTVSVFVSLQCSPALQDSAPSRRFARSALLFLSRAHTLDSDGAGRGVVRSARYSECWEDVGELWFLGMQALGGCVAELPWLADTVLQSGWLGDALELLRACPASADPDLRGALQAVLTPLAQHSQACRDFICKQQGEVIAKLHCMAELQRHLAGTG
ncbi:UNVERIFIED_CONTAM: hypothetical protein FKN15_078025 [Acipenser sinensis]